LSHAKIDDAIGLLNIELDRRHLQMTLLWYQLLWI